MIVPTHREPEGLDATLAPLREQTIGLDRFEVIVVNHDPSNPIDPDPGGLRLQVADEARPGAYAAFNTGVDRSTGSILAFTEAGCRPAHDWLERALAQLDADEQTEYLETLGLEEPGLNRLIRTGYDLLGLMTYFTSGPKETRAWTIRHGTKAPQAAGAIHTDFEKGFIRAETISFDDYVAVGGETPAKEAGKMRLEGKDYVVKDGDVMLFRFAT